MIAFLRNLILNDFWLKLLSLVLAVLTWLIVYKVFLNKEVSPVTVFANKAVEQSYFNIPVTLILSASDVRPVNIEPGEVRVTVQAEPKALKNLKPSEIRAQVDLTGIESARALSKRIEVILPSGITLTRVVPDQVEVVVPPRK
jgi:YbbR domain-containing protein